MRICAYIDGNGMGLIHAHISIRYYGLFNAKTPNALSHIEELRSITAMIKHSKHVTSCERKRNYRLDTNQLLFLWSRDVGEFFLVLINHEFGNVITRVVVYRVSDVAEFARAHTLVGHCDKEPRFGFYNSQIMNDKALVYCYRCRRFEFAGFFYEAKSYLGDFHNFPPDLNCDRK